MDRETRKDEDGHRCECGRWHEFPCWYPERRHILYTLICECGLVYTISYGCVELRTKRRAPRG